MDPEPSEELRRAVELMRSGNTGAARSLMADHVMRNPKSELGWMLLSYLVSDPKQQIDCLERVLRLNPANEKARERLGKLSAPAIPAATGGPSPAMAVEAPTFAEPPVAAASPEPESGSGLRSAPPFVETKEGEGEGAGGGEGMVERLREVAAFTPGTQEEPQPGEVPYAIWADRLKPGEEAPEPARVAPPAQVESVPEPAVPEPAPALPGAVEVPRRAERQRPARKGTPLWLLVLVGAAAAVVVCGAVGVGLAYFGVNLVPAGLLGQGTSTPVMVESQTLVPPGWTLPPKWTDTPPPSVTPTGTPTPAPSATATSMYETPNATVAASMDLVEKQVANLRGLTQEAAVPRYVISPAEAERTLEEAFFAVSSKEEVANEGRALEALGLIKPTYDLVKYSLNRMADGVGGFYLIDRKEMFVIGSGFSGVEKFIYAHEFGHALVDQHFGLGQMGTYPTCVGDPQRCEAVRALVEGDATLVMQQWLLEDAGPQDKIDLAKYNPPTYALPDQFPPPFVEKDVNFPYEAGLAFVKYLYDRGNWAEVNKAYADPPLTTEQVLHPAKYIAGEGAIGVEAPQLVATLGADWRLLQEGSLGEWKTYLILGYGADSASQLPDATAAAAARGWGGDHYQVLFDDRTSQEALAAQWAWDTPTDATEFFQAMNTYLFKRFRGLKVATGGANCWQANGEMSCLYSAGNSTLWLLGPDADTIGRMKAKLPGFH